MFGQLAASTGGGGVGAIDGEDLSENVAGFGWVVGVGDDVEEVLVRPRVAATYRPRRVVAAVVRARLMSTVSACQPCSVAA